MRKIISRKSILATLVTLSMCIFLVSCSSKLPYGAKELSDEEYKSYDKYGVIYATDESDSYSFIEQELKDCDKEIGHEDKNIRVYLYKNVDSEILNSLKESITECQEIVEIGFAEYIKGDTEYMIHYKSTNNETIMVSYSNQGIYNKTINDDETIVQVINDSSKMTKYVLETEIPEE